MGLCLVVFLPGLFSVPPVDRDESRFAQASRQMFESVALPEDQQDAALHGGGLTIPQVQDRQRLNKPPLIYWVQTDSAWIFTGGHPPSDAIWMYRVPSALAGMLAVLVTFLVGRRMFDPRAAFIGAALLAVSPIIVWEANQARADMVLLACTTGAMACLWCASRGRLAWTIPLGLCVGMGALTKGPITPMVVLLTGATFASVVRTWRPVLVALLGIVIGALVFAPWVMMLGAHPDVGWERLTQILREEVFERAASAKEGHWGPPGYHLIALVVLFWPGSLLVGIAIERAIRRGLWKKGLRAARTPEAFCLCWIVPSWLIFELSSTKLPHYTLPLYPPIALLTGRAVLAATTGSLPQVRNTLSRIGFLVWGVLGAALVVLAPVGITFMAATPETGRTMPLILLTITGLGAGALVLLAWRRTRDGQFVRTTWLSIAAACILAITLLQVALPRARNLFLSPWATRALEELDPSHERPVGLVGYHEDSLVFLTRGRAVRLGDGDAMAWLAEHPDALLVVAMRRTRGAHDTPDSGEAFGWFNDHAHELELLAERDWGFNYSNGSWMRIGIFQAGEVDAGATP